jgi:hypothetical protein
VGFRSSRRAGHDGRAQRSPAAPPTPFHGASQVAAEVIDSIGEARFGRTHAPQVGQHPPLGLRAESEAAAGPPSRCRTRMRGGALPAARMEAAPPRADTDRAGPGPSLLRIQEPFVVDVKAVARVDGNGHWGERGNARDAQHDNLGMVAAGQTKHRKHEPACSHIGYIACWYVLVVEPWGHLLSFDTCLHWRCWNLGNTKQSTHSTGNGSIGRQ